MKKEEYTKYYDLLMKKPLYEITDKEKEEVFDLIFSSGYDKNVTLPLVLRREFFKFASIDSGKTLFNYLKSLHPADLKEALKIWERLFNINKSQHSYIGEQEVKDRTEKDRGQYKYIPYNPVLFVALLEINKTLGRENFIDVGSGTYSKPLLAGIFGDFKTITGIEYNKVTNKFAKQYCKTLFDKTHTKGCARKNWFILKAGATKQEWGKDYEIICRDALHFNYSKYDFIYMYRPFNNTQMLEDLYKQVFETAPVGAFIIDVYGLCNRTFQWIGELYGKKAGERSKSKFRRIDVRASFGRLSHKYSGLIKIKDGKNILFERVNIHLSSKRS